MAGLKEINIRIKSVKNTKKITYAMKLVSATKMRGAQDAVARSREYSNALKKLLSGVLSATDVSELTHPLLEQRTINKIKLIVVGASRGLCGAYNSNINKAITAFTKEQKEKNPNVKIEAVLLGSKLAEFYQREKNKDFECYKDLPESVSNWPLDEICKQAEVEFLNGDVDAVYLIYTHFKSALTMTATVTQLLPITLDQLMAKVAETNTATSKSQTKFEPSSDEVFAALLPRLTRISLRQGALDAKASEHASRMTAMDNATRNAGDLIEGLTLTYNKLRQAGITGEILDIVGGANAV